MVGCIKPSSWIEPGNKYTGRRSIDARNGVIDFRAIWPSQWISEDTPSFAASSGSVVTAGEGRRLAQLLRAKAQGDQERRAIRCIVDDSGHAFEISLVENTIRSDMHPSTSSRRSTRCIAQ